MTDLIATLSGLTSPSREVDADIFQLLGGSEWDKAYIRAQEPCGCPHDLAVSTARERYSPAYTASIDAAVALCERVLPGWQWAVWGGAVEAGSTKPRCMAHVSDGRTQWTASDTPNAAIALLIAILTALEARDGTE